MLSPIPEVIGAGSFGAVVSPSLPNIDSPENPHNITKIYYDGANYEKAKRADERARGIPGLGLPTHEYTRKYTLRNLPPPLRTEFLDTLYRFRPLTTSSITENTPLHLSRMKKLGNSFHKIAKYPIEFCKIPYSIIIRQVSKLIQTVLNIFTAGYIHGDVRSSNILCNLETGEMQIIDFDWLLPFQEFIKRFPIYFYSQPPEGILLFRTTQDRTKLRGLYQVLSLDKSEWVDKLLSLSNHLLNFMGEPLGISAKSTFARVMYIYLQSAAAGFEFPKGGSLDELYRKGSPIYTKLAHLVIPTFDSYGLAGALRELLNSAWSERNFQMTERAINSGKVGVLSNRGHPYTTDEFDEFYMYRGALNKIIDDMMNVNVFMRLKPALALERIQEIIDDMIVVENSLSSPLSSMTMSSPAFEMPGAAAARPRSKSRSPPAGAAAARAGAGGTPNAAVVAPAVPAAIRPAVVRRPSAGSPLAGGRLRAHHAPGTALNRRRKSRRRTRHTRVCRLL